LLKRNGLLLLNEIVGKGAVMHLTFGLLDGWWRHEDEGLRLEGSPALAAETWRRVLEEEGFRSVSLPMGSVEGLGQQIIVAESDGMIRRARPKLEREPVELVVETAELSAASETLERRRAAAEPRAASLSARASRGAAGAATADDALRERGTRLFRKLVGTVL